jgi:mannose-6-phosphate isomerase-like protein (cupin superfamily)
MTLRTGAAAYELEAEGGERLRFGDVEVVVKASADTTGGAFTIFEENEPVDTSLHVHENEDELFYVLEGQHVFRVGDQDSRPAPGGSCSPRAVSRTPSGG